jgi:hypothetical protein
MPQDTDDQQKTPNATSPGNEGARGSRGQANSGAQSANSTNAHGNERAEIDDAASDLRDADAQGGGGVDSGSSRSK